MGDKNVSLGLRTLKELTRERILRDMLGTTRGVGSSDWKVLVLDERTLRVLSKSCKMTDILEEGISLIEDLNKKRQPQPSLDAVYFIQPSKESVGKFMADMSGKMPLYKRSHVFFSSTLRSELLQKIKSAPEVWARLACLREMNLEFLAVDTQGFITDNEQALEELFSEKSEQLVENCIDNIACRLATVFASMKEHPTIRYHAPSLNGSDSSRKACDLASCKLAEAVANNIRRYKSLPDYPQTETCELVIVSRSMDPVAPIIHEWTYEAMCHDLLDMVDNKYSYKVTTSSGKTENHDVLLDERDHIWMELRDLHIADVSLRLDGKMKTFGSQNKAAQIQLGSREGKEITTRDMKKMVQALPQYNEVLDKLGLHVHLGHALNELNGLSQVVQMENALDEDDGA